MDNIKESSRASYMNHVLDGKARTQRERIVQCITFEQVPLNRRQISMLTGIPINAVCGRARALLDDVKLVVSHCGVDHATNQRVEYLDLPREGQLEMFEHD